MANDASPIIRRQTETELNSIALVSALLSTVAAAMVLGASSMEWPVMKLTMALSSSVAFTCLLVSVLHSVYLTLMINEFGNLDELTRFLDRIGWLRTLPARTLIVGMWGLIGSLVSYLFEFLGPVGITIVVAICSVIFVSTHLMLMQVMKSFHGALHDVKEGYRIEEHRKNME